MKIGKRLFVALCSFLWIGYALAADDLVNSQITDYEGASTTLDALAPPVILADDCVIYTGQIQNGGTPATFTAPSGSWSELDDFGDGFAIGGFAYLLYPAVGDEDGTTINVTASESVSGHGQIFVVSPCGGLDDWARKPSDDTGTTEAPTAIDVTANDTLVVQVIHMARPGSETDIPTEPSGTTDAPGDAPLGTNNRQVTAVAEYDQATSGTAVTSTATWGGITEGVARTLWTFSFLNVGGGGSSPVNLLMQQQAANDDQYGLRLVANQR